MESPAEPTASRKPPARLGRHTILCLAFYYALYFSGGVIDALMPPVVLGAVLTYTGALNLGLWAVLDAGRRGRPLPLLSQSWFVIFAAVLVPGYVIYSRRWRGVGWLILHVIGANVVMLIGFAVVVFLVYGSDGF